MQKMEDLKDNIEVEEEEIVRKKKKFFKILLPR
mgnify:CR=1 FL=1